uniref:Uncharacterized protein n=1 Tax=Sphaerodactylus townsendi TaxID=933632 RepID=A0ACB8FV19_9SAUR
MTEAPAQSEPALQVSPAALKRKRCWSPPGGLKRLFRSSLPSDAQHASGESNTVVWNEIHHKTEMSSNASGHGYPDPNYLDNVLAELAAQGVTEDCLRS